MPQRDNNTLSLSTSYSGCSQLTGAPFAYKESGFYLRLSGIHGVPQSESIFDLPSNWGMMLPVMPGYGSLETPQDPAAHDWNSNRQNQK